MWYIVYKEKFKSYTETGGGYFVGYKNKIEDTYSDNYVEANKYKAIGAALTRLGIEIKPSMDSMDRFLESIRPRTKAAKRNRALSNIFDETTNPIDVIFSNGRIEKVSINGELLGSASDDVLRYIEGKISRNKEKMDRIRKAVEPIVGKSSYLIETKEGEDFWDGF